MALPKAERGEKELKTNYPVVEGTTFETTKTHTRVSNLIPTAGSKVLSRNKPLI